MGYTQRGNVIDCVSFDPHLSFEYESFSTFEQVPLLLQVRGCPREMSRVPGIDRINGNIEVVGHVLDRGVSFVFVHFLPLSNNQEDVHLFRVGET